MTHDQHAPSGRTRKDRNALRLATLAAALTLGAAPATAATTVRVVLAEWSVTLSPARVPPGEVTFEIRNAGSIPHGFEIEGHGIEREVANLARGASGRLAVTLEGGAYEVYCPIGNGSHEKLGMKTTLTVAAGRAGGHATMAMGAMEDHAMHAAAGAGTRAQAAEIEGGGPVIQILPGPFPFADSAAAVIASRPPDQRADLASKAHMGPYSNRVARIAGTLHVLAVDRGASGDSVSGLAEFATQDGARWKLAIDRVQTRDIPDNPRFGGVIMGLYYHGASGVHTPLVPTIQSRVALWAYAHLWRDGTLVTDDAMVHIMLLSRTRRPPDYALACWDCSRNPIDELQLQVTPSPGQPKFDAPGGFLFVNWEASHAVEEPVR